MSLQAGQFTKRISIRAMTRTDDGMGGYTETSADVGPIWARVEPLTGMEMIQAQQTGMRRPYRFTIRYRDDLTGSKTLVYGTRTFDIQSIVDPEELHQELILTSDEVNA